MDWRIGRVFHARYMGYLESGKFADVGLEKFSRVVATLEVPADQVLRAAGYLPEGVAGLLDPRVYSAAQYRLSPSSVGHAVSFLEFLADRE